MKVLKRTQFGNPVLRAKTKLVPVDEIKSDRIQMLINDMSHTLTSEKLGVGLAAPQVGKILALSVIKIRPLPHRPEVKELDMVLINPEIIETIGLKKDMWEGCISAGQKNAGLFAKVPRYQIIKVKYYDENSKLRHRTLTGLPAQVVQHEVDHLNGVLFVDRVKDTTTYMTYAEYIKRVRNKRSK